MQLLTKQPIPILLVFFTVAAVAMGISVWPLPSNYSTGDDVLWVAEDVRFTYKVLHDSVIDCTCDRWNYDGNQMLICVSG